MCFLTNESNVKVNFALKAGVVWEAAERGNATEDGVGLQIDQSLRANNNDIPELQTCVPPSPGSVLYHRPSCGPANGS